MMSQSTESDQKKNLFSGRGWLFLAGFALLKIIIHLPFLTRYGFHHDELYFIACGNHFSTGYVDHPPLVPWIAKLSTTLFGDSLLALRFFALMAGAAAVFLTGILVRRLGGGRFAQGLACLSMMIAPVFLRTSNMLAIPSFEPLIWLLASYALVRMIREENPKWWLAVGLFTGFGLMNKHSMLFFAFGLVIGLVLTPMRKHFKSRWLYAGGAVALLVFLPNLVWQITHGWPTLNFLISLNEGVMSGISALQFIAGQLLYLNPVNAVVWITGLVWFFKKEGREFRILGWIWVAVCLLLLLIKSKIYYLAPAYPALIAGGAVALEGRIRSTGRKWLKPVSCSLLIVSGAFLFPLSVPVLNIDALERYANTITFNAFGNIYEVTGDLRAMFGWRERVEAVARVYSDMPEEERKHTMLLANGYGNAGAIDLFGKVYGLPRASSLTLSYWIWGYSPEDAQIVMGVGFPKESLEKVFRKVEVVSVTELQHVNPSDKTFTITICSEPVKPLKRLWQRNRPW